MKAAHERNKGDIMHLSVDIQLYGMDGKKTNIKTLEFEHPNQITALKQVIDYGIMMPIIEIRVSNTGVQDD